MCTLADAYETVAGFQWYITQGVNLLLTKVDIEFSILWKYNVYFIGCLHRFFAWYYFKAKKPDAYIKSMATHRLNKMFVWEHTLQTFEAVSKPIQNFLNNNLIMVNLTNGTVFT